MTKSTQMPTLPRGCSCLPLAALFLLTTACGGGDDGGNGGDGPGNGGSGGDGPEISEDGGSGGDGPEIGEDTQAWFAAQTIAVRSTLSIPGGHEWLLAQPLAVQLQEYDPGSTVRCAVENDPAYAAVIDELGGVQWKYQVRVLPDTSKPIFKLGFDALVVPMANAGAADSSGVEIAEADIVGVSDTSALFISKQHGLLMTDLSGDQATFRCAAKLPGEVDQFYLHRDRLVVIVQDATRQTGHLLHFSVANDELAPLLAGADLTVSARNVAGGNAQVAVVSASQGGLHFGEWEFASLAVFEHDQDDFHVRFLYRVVRSVTGSPAWPNALSSRHSAAGWYATPSGLR